MVRIILRDAAGRRVLGIILDAALIEWFYGTGFSPFAGTRRLEG